jgi:hypothetical protein
MLIKKTPFHPFLIFIFPVISLLANNLQEMYLIQAVRPALASLILACILFLFFVLIFRDTKKAAILTTFSGLMFFSYGFIYEYLRTHPLVGVNLGRHSLFGSFYLILFIFFFILLIRKKNYGGDPTLVLNVISIILITMPLYQILQYETKPEVKSTDENSAYQSLLKWQKGTLAENPILPEFSRTDEKPDIYLIILDMYGRQDALAKDIHFDNSTFIGQLRELGFNVATCSRSNYAQTRFSLSSMLNLNYIQGIQGGGKMDDILEEGIKHSLVRKELSELGYKTIAFATGFPFSEIKDADLYIAPNEPGLFDSSIQPFEAMIVKTTMLRLLIDLHPDFLSGVLNSLTFPYTPYTARLDSALEGLKKLPQEESPKFVFAHLMIPHPPYIYNPDGSIRMDDRYYREALNQPVSEEFFEKGYLSNMEYANRAILPVLQEIITKSKTQPIIILAGDHGIRDQNRLDNLAAIYLPNSKDKVYSSITPVNYFRVIINSTFQTDFPLLEDRSYFSGYPDRYELSLIEELSPSCKLK